MAVYVTEYSGYASGRPNTPGFPTDPPIQTQVFSSAATSTSVLSTATRLVRIVADANAWVLIGGLSTTVVATSTNAGKIIANSPPEYHYVNPAARLSVLST